MCTIAMHVCLADTYIVYSETSDKGHSEEWTP